MVFLDSGTNLRADISLLSRKYQFMELNTTRRATSLREKIPDITKTLDTVIFLSSRSSSDDLADDDDEKPSALTTTFELNDTLYAKATIPTDLKEVYLWLGANVMLSYPIDEAEKLLKDKLRAAKESLKNCEEDLEFLKKQITTLEVNTARLFNHEVTMKRKEREEMEEGKGKS